MKNRLYSNLEMLILIAVGLAVLATFLLAFLRGQ
jgi:hypothetical protein